ncbi:hypothetical protein AACH06_01580 [Ideonella sp. DXS29W]|uniref:Uncharacterized protein n=1 Tax=Ideonella lacteola TaxID=2984193 RepID=A0ABU9BHR8_9BURK
MNTRHDTLLALQRQLAHEMPGPGSGWAPQATLKAHDLPPDPPASPPAPRPPAGEPPIEDPPPPGTSAPISDPPKSG